MYTTLSTVREAVTETCQRCRHPEVAAEINRKIEFSNRMTRAAGSASVQHKKIKLSRVLFGRNTTEGRLNTIIHEVCHILTHIENPRASAHGWEWKMMMRRAGIANPQRCHTIDRTGLKRKMNLDRYEYDCDCGSKAAFTSRKMKNMIKAGIHRFRCAKCKRTLVVERIIQVEKAA